MPVEGPSKVASVAIIATCQVAAMALWFSASAIIPALVAEFHIGGFSQAALTSGVQAGFVAGCLASAFPRPCPTGSIRGALFAVSAAIGAASNALLLVVDPRRRDAAAARRHRRCMAASIPSA
jgi:hypothetical protein